jgi:hypothetical protein
VRAFNDAGKVRQPRLDEAADLALVRREEMPGEVEAERDLFLS